MADSDTSVSGAAGSGSAHSDTADIDAAPLRRPSAGAVPPAVETIRLVLVRHGETAWNAAGIQQGHHGPGLSARGMQQAAAAAAQVARRFGDAAAIVTSDLPRARESAAAIAARLPQAPLWIDARLREVDAGRWTGRTLAEIALDDGAALRAWLCGEDCARGGGETRAVVFARVSAALADVALALHAASAHGGRPTAIVVTHCQPIHLFAASLLGLLPHGWRALEAPRLGSITVVQVVRVDGASIAGRIESYNECLALDETPDH